MSRFSKITDRRAYKMKLKKGDTVIVRAGALKGKTGKITATHPRTGMVTIEGLNVVKRHQKPTRLKPQGGIFEITKPLAASKVSLFESGTKKPSRIGMKVNAKTGAKVRVFKRSGKEVKV